LVDAFLHVVLMDITELLAFRVKNKASDLHLSPACRR
jgi:Tfp pilus assembly pilus retraction ATPase PilT